MSAGPGRGPIKARGSGWATWRTEAYGGSAPETASLSASSLALVLGCPSSAARSPYRAGVVPVRASGYVPCYQPNVLSPSSLRGKGPTPSRALIVPETLLVESDLLGQHVVDGPTELGGQDAQGLGLAELLLLLLHPLLGPVAAAQKQAGGLRERPAQVRVADLLATRALLLAGRLVLAADQPGIAEEMTHVGKAADVMDLVKKDEGQDLTDAGNRLQPEIGLRIIDLGGTCQVQLHVAEQLVVLVDQGEIDLHRLVDAGIGEAVGDVQFLPIGGVAELQAEGRMVVLAVGVLDVSDGLGSLMDQVLPAAQQVAGLAHAGGVDVGLGQRAAAQEPSDLAGVDLVVLALAAVDGLHVESVAQHEGNLLLGAQVGEPVPAEQAFDGDDQPVTKRFDGGEERIGPRRQVLVVDDLALVVEDAQVHGPGVQIDATVESVLLGVETHHGPPWAWVRRLSPHRG